MQQYEEKQDEESLFVWTVDKMQQLIMGDLDAWRCYVEGNISYEQFVDKYTYFSQKGSIHCRDIFESLIEHCRATYERK